MNLLKLANQVQNRHGLINSRTVLIAADREPCSAVNFDTIEVSEADQPLLNRIGQDPYLYSQWKETIRTNRMVEQGKIPEGFVYKARCQRCGDILLDYQVSCELVACPWCFCRYLPNFTEKY